MTDEQNNRSIFPEVIDSPRLVFEYQDGKFETNSSVRIVSTERTKNERTKATQKEHEMLTKRLLMRT